MSSPVAVLISDIHYNISTLELADAALRMAIYHANKLRVPLVIAGDMHDTKANLRAECVHRMQKTLRLGHQVIVLRGNHDSLNEKSEVSAIRHLEFGSVSMVDEPSQFNSATGIVHLIPYQSDPNKMRSILAATPKNSLIVMHQGLNGSNSGEYIRDNSAINPEDVANFRVISGHYHARQDIKTGRPRANAVGLFSYIGNPFTLTFGEAKDLEKGYQVLLEDGTLEFIPTNLRKHVVFEMTASDIHGGHVLLYNPADLLWLKITGTHDELAKLNRDKIIKTLRIEAASVRIDTTPVDIEASAETQGPPKTDGHLMDELIMTEKTLSDEQKGRLAQLWRNLL